jgi:TatD DNase family protein
MNFWFDTHCHPHYSPLIEDIEAILHRAAEANVLGMVCVSTNFSDSEAIIPIMHLQSPIKVFRSIGVHPLSATKYTLSELVQGLESSNMDGVVAIGETGLDDFRDPLTLDQIPAFEAHIRFAEAHNLPIIMHSRGGENSVVEKEAKALIRDSSVKGIAHCFGGSEEFCEFLLEKGWYISFSGNITYKKSEELREIARKVPLNRILVETDAPFLPPQGQRGKPNEPAYVTHVGRTLAEIRVMDVEELMSITMENAKCIFNLT